MQQVNQMQPVFWIAQTIALLLGAGCAWTAFFKGISPKVEKVAKAAFLVFLTAFFSERIYLRFIL